ncbi:MAG TPA: FmdB family zinc ribbon protein [Bryobacteraceae bacterium]|jgi:putative FmdB family regulatory protein
MPLYEYQCSKCGEKIEVLQKFSDAPLTRHKGCRGALHRLVSAPGLHFKGSGWYVNDYAAKGSGKSEGKSESNGESKSESKGSESKGSESKSSESKASESKASESKSSSDSKPAAKETKAESKPAKNS